MCCMHLRCVLGCVSVCSCIYIYLYICVCFWCHVYWMFWSDCSIYGRQIVNFCVWDILCDLLLFVMRVFRCDKQRVMRRHALLFHISCVLQFCSWFENKSALHDVFSSSLFLPNLHKKCMWFYKFPFIQTECFEKLFEVAEKIVVYLQKHHMLISIFCYRTGGVSRRRASRSVTCDNAQLPMLSEPCSCWPAAASVGSGH